MSARRTISPDWNRGAPVPAEMNDHPVSLALSDAWDGGDPWGSAMAEGFALCDFVTFELGCGSEIPTELRYVPSPFGAADTDGFVYQSLTDAFEASDFTADEAIEYLSILNRYIDACVLAGLDY